MIGDPSGKTSERPLASQEEIEANSRSIEKQLERFLDFSGPRPARMRDNIAWLRPLKAVEFMRDVGKHFTVNYMLAKESVRSRVASEPMQAAGSLNRSARNRYDYVDVGSSNVTPCGVGIGVGSGLRYGSPPPFISHRSSIALSS